MLDRMIENVLKAETWRIPIVGYANHTTRNRLQMTISPRDPYRQHSHGHQADSNPVGMDLIRGYELCTPFLRRMSSTGEEKRVFAFSVPVFHMGLHGSYCLNPYWF